MRLHENKALFDQAIRATGSRMEIPDIYIEKDYWVTLALHTIFTDDIGKESVFKGGTSLSKCYGLIHRFSEDIDLVVFRNPEEKDKELTKKIRTISKTVEQKLPEVHVEGITNKKGMNRKTAHSYPQAFNGEYGQVRKEIIVEATWLGYHEPYVEKQVYSYVYEMMMATGQEKMITEYGLEPFKVWVLDVKRTICEKIMSLVRFSYEENPIEALSNKVRHTYDLHLLLKDGELSEYFDSEDFKEMLLKVAQDDVGSFKNNNKWLVNHPSDALIFKDVDGTWEQIKSVYEGSFSQLVFRDLPPSEDVRQTLERISKRLSEIEEWDIAVE